MIREYVQLMHNGECELKADCHRYQMLSFLSSQLCIDADNFNQITFSQREGIDDYICEGFYFHYKDKPYLFYDKICINDCK